jgi:2-oxoglutarate-dependent dioxygenase
MKIPAPLDNEQVAFFQEHGYLGVGPVLDAEELAALRAAYDRIFHGTEKPASYRNLGKKEGEEVSAGAVLQIIDMHKLDDAFCRILHKEALLDVTAALLGAPNVRLYHDQGLFKPPRIGDVVPWHQDNGYWRLEPPGAASCWIALDDATLENGCMWVLPGSHKAGVVDHQRAGQTIQLEAAADETRAVSVPLPAGSAMFHHCQTLHRTLPNETAHQRRAWVIHYMPAQTWQRGRLLEDRPLLRGA